MVEVVNSIVSNLKIKHGNRFIFYLTGSFARNEKDFKDYDIAVYDNYNNKKDWEPLLKSFYNKKLENWDFIKYTNIYGNLWEKQIMLVKPKHRDMGLDKIKRIYVEL